MEENIWGKETIIYSLGKTYCTEDWYWDTQNFNWGDFDLWTVIKGEGRLETARKVYELVSGDCFILRSQERYIGSHNPANPLVVINVHFNFLDNKGKVYNPLTYPPLYRRIQGLSFFKALLERVLSFYPKDKYMANRWLQMVLMEIFKQDAEITYSGLELKQEQLIDSIVQKIITNPGNFHSIEDIAADLSYSKDHFLRIFKKFKGVTPYEFLINCRLETAKNLLLSSSHSISRIAEIVGYKDLYHFSRQFKEKTGISPSEYRKGL